MNKNKWKATRAKGKKRFVWMVGFAGWGISTALLWTLCLQVVQPAEAISIRLTVAFAFFPLAGLAGAHFVWNSVERKYRSASRGAPE